MSETVYFSSALSRYPDLLDEAASFLKENGVTVKLVEGTKNIWIRDWACLQIGDHFVKFRYIPDKKYPQLKVLPSCYEQFDPIHSNVILDGGNVVKRGDKAILTKKVLKDNPGLNISKLEKLLEAEITLIPIEPYAPIGHSDGICHFLPNGSILTNNYQTPQKYYREYYKRLLGVLKGFSIELFPCAYSKCPQMTLKEFRRQYPDGDDFNPAFGCYINYLEVGNVILLPKFEIVEDEEALTKIKHLYPEYKVKQIDCSDLSMEGGVLRCISWNLRGNGNYRSG